MMNGSNNSALQIQAPSGLLQGIFDLPVSKSLINRQLILHALTDAPLPEMPDHLPEDIAQLCKMLYHPGPLWDAGEGGTTFRFLTAFLAIRGEKGIVTASSRMQQRPIEPLVDALRQLGVEINYVDKQGFPPVQLNGFTEQQRHIITIDASQSSQFLSAILLVAPRLPNGITLKFPQGITSRPYVDMTLNLLQARGIRCEIYPNKFTITPSLLDVRPFHWETDWTAASYPYAHLALAPIGSQLFLPNLLQSGWQGDEHIASWMEMFGITSRFTPEGTFIEKGLSPAMKTLSLDLRAHPDLAQTLIILAGVTGVGGRFCGLHTLAIKETNRNQALQTELAKGGIIFNQDEDLSDNCWNLTPGSPLPLQAPIATYQDHRMAMAMSLFCWLGPVAINDPGVVKKSFPTFWNSLDATGFKIKMQRPYD